MVRTNTLTLQQQQLLEKGPKNILTVRFTQQEIRTQHEVNVMWTLMKQNCDDV